MSAEEKVNEQPKRRRGLRRQTEEAEVVKAEAEVDDEMMDGEDDDESSERGMTGRKGRATPSRRTQDVEAVKPEGNIITRTINKLREYMEGVNSERQKIVWPTREETRRLTTIVLVSTIVAAIVLGAVSLLFNVLLDAGLKSPGLIFGGLFLVITGIFVYYLWNSNRRTSSF